MKTRSFTRLRCATRLRRTSVRQAARQAFGGATVVAALTFLWLAPSGPLRAGPTNAITNPSATTNPPAPGAGAAGGAAGGHAKAEVSPGVPPPFLEPPVPESIFVMTKGPADGKDPFFPKSTPWGVAPTPNTKTGPAPVVAELILRGISGTDQQPLAIINTTTFGVGDELDVTTKAGKIRIRCLEINKAAGTVLVQMGGERRELRLPPAK